MKIKNILFIGMTALTMIACSDYLEVDAPSAYTEEFVFSQKSEMSRALNGVYAQALVNNLYGDAYYSRFTLNSDVDITISSDNSHSHSTYARFDCDDQGSHIYSFWTAAYNLIEYCNKFITSAQNSELYNTSDSEFMQWIGEAKCLRAMAYHDLVVMFGDVPFTMEPSTIHGTDFVIAIKDREEIQKALIEDLKQIAPYMASTNSTTVERCSKEFAHALIARIALTAGGYSLRPDKGNPKNYGTMQRPTDYQDFYRIAMQYADSVISAGTHQLAMSYQEVFVNECNYRVVNNDDPIFEIPFARESTGNIGYLQGPSYAAYEGKTVGPWGATSGSSTGGRVNAFYRFLFRDGDQRREFVNGMWYYNYYTTADGSLADSVYIRNDYSVHNNKWSKLWTAEGSALGNITTGSTGINYPYMRYADVLLMYAEAANELNGGPTDKAVQCLTQVHNRAFLEGDPEFIAQAQSGKEAFQKAVLDERKWEFAGENSRWRDLVRTNTYGEELIYSFLRYYSAGMQNVGGNTGYEDDINLHDGYTTEAGYIDNLPERIYYHQYYIDEANAYGLRMYKAQLYGYVLDGSANVISKYPNQSLKSLRIYNAYKPASSQPITSAITRGGFSAAAWNRADFYQWGNNDSGTPRDQCKYSFYGYIRGDDGGNLWIINNGTQTQFSSIPQASELPPVRYILPYPNLAIQRSAGAYQNYYGY
jgi:hypothetical protein